MAAGQGTRMKSPLPKVLHPVAGWPMLQRVIGAVKGAGAKEVRVIVGYGENLVRQVVEPLGVTCHAQKEQKGTADAVRSAQIEDLEGTVLILNGDHPLISEQDVKNIIEDYVNNGSDLTLVSSTLKKPGHFGRVVRHQGQLRAVVEVKDASQDTLNIREVNTGIYVTDAAILKEYLPKINNNNAQKEFYLTDLIGLCFDDHRPIEACRQPVHVAFGVNTQSQLSKASRFLFRKKAQELLEKGVMIIDPTQTYIEEDVSVGEASVLYPGVYLRNGSQIGKFCVIESNSYISGCQIGDSVQIKAGCYLEESVIEMKTSVGPYAHLRPGNQIGKNAKIGNFVEMKKVNFGEGAKASHLTYLGDAIIGKNTNIGCGTITCNYAADKKKYVTKIGENVFVGSDTQFVAPVEVGDNSVVASGSTITKDVPEGALAIARGRQVVKENYKPRVQTVEPKTEVAPAETVKS